MFNTAAFMIVVGGTTLSRGIGEHIPNKLTACSWHSRAKRHGMAWFLAKHCGRVTTITAWSVALVLTAFCIEKRLGE